MQSTKKSGAALLAVLFLASLLTSFAMASPASAAGRVGMVSSPGVGTNYVKLQWPAYKTAYKYKVSTSASYSMSKASNRWVRAASTTVSGLTSGKEYCFQVRAYKKSGKHLATSRRYCKPAARLALPANGTATKIITYNVCSNACDENSDYRKKGLRSWADRKSIVANLLKSRNPDLVALQEASKWQDVEAYMPGYSRSRHVSGNPTILLYKDDRFSTTVDARGGERSGGFPIGDGRWASWAELTDKLTGDTRIHVSVHLKTGKGSGPSAMRKRETTSMVNQIKALNVNDVPVIYTGDFNTNKSRGYSLDTPTRVLQANGHYDSFDSAATLSRPNFNSGGDGTRNIKVSYRWGDHIDRVYVPAGEGIGVQSWANIEPISNGKWKGPLGSDHHPLEIVLRTAAR